MQFLFSFDRLIDSHANLTLINSHAVLSSFHPGLLIFLLIIFHAQELSSENQMSLPGDGVGGGRTGAGAGGGAGRGRGGSGSGLCSSIYEYSDIKFTHNSKL